MKMRITICLAFLFFSPSSFAGHSDFIRVGSVQFPIEANQTREKFLKKFESFIEKASKKKVDLVLFPEWVVLDLWPLEKKMADSEVVAFIANDFTTQYWDALKTYSKKYNLIIAGGSTAERVDGKIYNTAVMVFPDGRIVKQRKKYLTKWEKDNGLSPGREIELIETEFGNLVMLICYDVEFPDISTNLAEKAVDLILVPSMTESVAGQFRVRWTSQSRAVEHVSYVVISPTFGEVAKNWDIFGTAVFITPQLPNFPGVLKEGKPSKSEVVVATLSLEKLKRAKRDTSWSPATQIKHKD